MKEYKYYIFLEVIKKNIPSVQDKNMEKLYTPRIANLIPTTRN